MKPKLSLLALFCFIWTTHACMWDARTLATEKSRSHDLASTILGVPPEPVDTNSLQAEIKSLEADRHENDPDWWNNLAGSHLRLNQPDIAAKLLEPVVAKFPDNYGIHANLGTAYHLLGRYADAEKEIARDLEINPDAHFGLEKYHLALLQYLIRDTHYQSRHLYVDEYTGRLLSAHGGWTVFFPSTEALLKTNAPAYTNTLAEAEKEYEALAKYHPDSDLTRDALVALAFRDEPPAYRSKSFLIDTNFESGVIYMAQMNPKEPACVEMLGIAAWRNHDYHLAAVAFEKAITLGSPQSGLLRQRIIELNHYIRESYKNTLPMEMGVAVFIVILILLVFRYIYGLVPGARRLWKKNA